MAYEFRNESGFAQIGGNPSREEIQLGLHRDNNELGELCTFEELYGCEDEQ